MEMEKKNLAIIILAVVLAASGIGNVILAVFGGLIVSAPSKTTLVYGLGSNPAALDPCDTWDIPSHPLQDQVTESLVEYDLTTHPGYQIKPEIATDWKWLDNKTIKFRIRDDVWFHDGTPLTAEAVQWNFERANWFFNGTGTLPANATSWEGFPSSLYHHSVTYEPIFNSFAHNEADTWDDGETCMTFTVELNFVFGAFLDLLCFGAVKMLSPASTPRYRYLDLADDVLVGTGPYKWIHFKRDREVRMERNPRWWGTGGYFEVVIFRIIEDTTARMTAGLAGQFDYVGGVPGSQIDTFKARPSEFVVEDVGEDLCYMYIELYCGPRDNNGDFIVNGTGKYQAQKNPPWLRRAIALSINFTYIYEEIQGGYATKGVPAVPRAFAAHNSSVVQAHDLVWENNVERARQIMKDNLPTSAAATEDWDVTFGGTDEADWTAANLIGRVLELNRHFGSTTNLRLNQLLADNLALIGLKTTETIREWGDYLDTGEQTPWEMDIGYIGWCPDYLNPFNMIDPLFNLASHSCFSRINDSSPGGLTDLMNAGGNELNLTIQSDIWKKVQSYIYDINRPLNPASHAHISGWVYLVQSIHKVGLIRDEYNVMSNWHIERWYYEE
jgi:peptide/nickel transport system substrate-binding protein